MLKYCDCPPVAVLSELGWPAMTITQKFDFSLKLKNLKNCRLAGKALNLTLNTTEGISLCLPPSDALTQITKVDFFDGRLSNLWKQSDSEKVLSLSLGMLVS